VIQNGCNFSASLGLILSYFLELSGSLPTYDHCGYGVAIQMLLSLQETGWYLSVYKQFDTIHRFKTAFGNHIRAYAQANSLVASLGNSDGKTYQ
jgi:hypothetical protein